MSFLNKVYSHDRDENYKAFVESLKISEDEAKTYLNFKPSESLKKEGDEYILNTTVPEGGSKNIKFKNGVEFDEEVAPGYVGKTKFVVEGNVFIQYQKFGDFSLVYRREYADDELVIVFSSNKFDGSARRFYKAA